MRFLFYHCCCCRLKFIYKNVVETKIICDKRTWENKLFRRETFGQQIAFYGGTTLRMFNIKSVT